MCGIREPNSTFPAHQEGEADSYHVEKHFYLEKCFEQKLIRKCGKENYNVCGLGGWGVVVRQSQIGSPLGRMTFKLRRSVMRSCQPAKVLEHSEQ